MVLYDAFQSQSLLEIKKKNENKKICVFHVKLTFSNMIKFGLKPN